MNIQIGPNIRILREAKSMTQEALAKRIGVSKATISAYENSSRLPSYDVLIRLARLFRVSTDNLLGLSDRYTIDVTPLTAKQRNTLNEIIALYECWNENEEN